MNRRLPTAAAILVAGLAIAPATAQGAVGVAPAQGFAPGELVVKFEGAKARTIAVSPRRDIREAVATLRANPRVAYAAPNFIATASALPGEPETVIPNDPGPISGLPGPPGGWVAKQWNLLPWKGEPTPLLPISPGGLDAVSAWRHLEEVGRPGAKGVTIAVLDTGVAYRSLGEGFRRSPDFSAGQFLPGYDFVDDDAMPLDENGHGTHVAGTIAEKTNNGVGLAGLAYRAKLVPVRVLDAQGRGRADAIAQGIRFAISKKVDVINMSFNFGCHRKVPGVDEALRQAYKRGIVTVASIGNLGAEGCISPPATGPHVVGVAGSTEGGCLGAYSLTGNQIDVTAPGGGPSMAGCPSISSGPIYQVTLKGGSTRIFGEPGNYIGTSMAAAHVSGVAAMVLASGVIPHKLLRGRQKATQVTKRLARTARGLGHTRFHEGAGLIDAGLATDRTCQQACLLEPR
jgi:serine protease